MLRDDYIRIGMIEPTKEDIERMRLSKDDLERFRQAGNVNRGIKEAEAKAAGKESAKETTEKIKK